MDKGKWYYRTADGSCNWIKKGESDIGMKGYPLSRDFGQTSFADGVSAPRQGPNPRLVSNKLFRRNKELYFEHTSILLGLIEFIIHDVVYSEDDKGEVIEVDLPEDDWLVGKGVNKMHVYRTSAAKESGTDRTNPRQNANMATAWLDVSSLYGSDEETARSLRSFQGGMLKVSHGKNAEGDYLPRGIDAMYRKNLFAGGDPRTNQDWLLLGIHTLMLREHNRLCAILLSQPRFSHLNDEEVYQTVRVILSSKYAMIANAYQHAYFSKKAGEAPLNDGFYLWRAVYKKSILQLNPLVVRYPWDVTTREGKPMIASQEMSIGYRFHDLIVETFPLKSADGKNITIAELPLQATVANAEGFLSYGLECVLGGMASTPIPNFQSGVAEAFRTWNIYNETADGDQRWTDLAMLSIVHERERGVPSFNAYFRAFNSKYAMQVPIRKTFEDFTSDPAKVALLKELYATPDDVDLVVGEQLEESLFPSTSVPKSSLIVSLVSLFGLGNSDRFSPGYSAWHCLFVEQPWDCTPSNALDEVLWEPRPILNFPRARWWDSFWMTELDFQARGANLLWKLVTDNTKIKCLQTDPLFPYDATSNPIKCKA